MTTLEPAAPTALRFAPGLFTATIFLSALLLFLVQPMFAKMVLPRLGGAPQVWSVAMVFFQAALLAGYAYAHLLVRHLSPGRGALIHLAVLAAAATCLPIAIAQGFGVPPTSGITIWLIGLFTVSIGCRLPCSRPAPHCSKVGSASPVTAILMCSMRPPILARSPR
jgi:hypothetical protein